MAKCGSNVMQVLHIRTRQIGQGYVVQQSVRDWADLRAPGGGVLQVIVRNRLARARTGTRIEKLDRNAHCISFGVMRTHSRVREITATLGQGWHRGKRVIGVLPTRSVVVEKEKRLAPTLVNPGNV